MLFDVIIVSGGPAGLMEKTKTGVGDQQPVEKVE